MATSKKTPAPEGSFALTFDTSTGACSRCAGLPTLRVEDTKGVIGYVAADWPWDSDFPAEPTHHPAEPHYEVEWFAQDTQRHDILGIRASDPYFIARAIYDAHRAGQAAS